MVEQHNSSSIWDIFALLCMLAIAPLIGLAYVMALPFIGFSMLFIVFGEWCIKSQGDKPTTE